MATDSWCVQRKFQHCHFQTVRGSYQTEAKAKVAAYKESKSVLGNYRWRIVCDGGPQEGRILEAEFVPGKRSVWTVTQEAHKL